MAVRGNRRESGTLNKEVQIVSSLGDDYDATIGDADQGGFNAYIVPNAARDSQSTTTPKASFALGTTLTIDQMIDEMRDADNQIQAQLYANLIPSNEWERLPGGSADFGQEATSLTDTIFGDGYDSMFPGLITGTITGNAIIKGIPGYQVVIRQTGRGYSIADPGVDMEAVPEKANTFRFKTQPTSGGRTTAPSYTFDLDDHPIYDGTGTTFSTDPMARNDFMITATGTTPKSITVNYLFGEVTFIGDDTTKVTGVTFAGPVVPLNTVGRAQNYNLTQTLNPVDETDFDTAQNNEGRRKFVAGLKSANLELSGFWRNTNNFLQQLDGRDRVLMYIDPTGEGDAICAMYCFLMRQGQRGDVGALEEESVNFELNVLDDERVREPVGWRFNYYTYDTSRARNVSRVSRANQILLDSWLCGTHLGVRYLPNGRDKTDGRISTGYSVAAIVTDASLSSSLDGVAEFQASFQLDGHVARRGQVTMVRMQIGETLLSSGDEFDVAAGTPVEVMVTLTDENSNPLAAREDLTLQLVNANHDSLEVGAGNARWGVRALAAGDSGISIGVSGSGMAGTPIVVDYNSMSKELEITVPEDGSGNVVTTAQELIDAINADTDARVVVEAYLPGGDGSAVVLTQSPMTDLTGGDALDHVTVDASMVIPEGETNASFTVTHSSVGKDMIQFTAPAPSKGNAWYDMPLSAAIVANAK